MRRLMILGPPGSGKTFLAAYLGTQLQIPVFNLDKLCWNPGWKIKSSDEMQSIHDEIFACHEWIVDGFYRDTFLLRYARADVVIFLDYPRRVYILRAVLRKIKSCFQQRSDLAEGCTDRMDRRFRRYLWNYYDEESAYIRDVLSNEKNKRVYVIKTPKAYYSEVRRVIDDLC